MDQNELVCLYEGKSNPELIFVLESKTDYTEETVGIVMDIIDQRGGYEKLKLEVDAEINKASEILELKKVANYLLEKKMDLEEIKQKINCKYLSDSEIEDILYDAQSDFNEKLKDEKVSTSSVLTGIIGGGLGGIVGGVLWGFSMIKSGKMINIFAFGTLLISYFLVWLFSRKSINNRGTVIIIILSVVLALIIGQVLLEIFGVEEYVG